MREQDFPEVQRERLRALATQRNAPVAQAVGPRLFTLNYDSSKIKTRNAFNREQFSKRHTLYGVVWPATSYAPSGGVSLSNSTTFRDLSEVREHFAQAGTATLTWLESGEVEEIG